MGTGVPFIEFRRYAEASPLYKLDFLKFLVGPARMLVFRRSHSRVLVSALSHPLKTSWVQVSVLGKKFHGDD
jgi:hypothetical protein